MYDKAFKGKVQKFVCFASNYDVDRITALCEPLRALWWVFMVQVLKHQVLFKRPLICVR